VYLWVCYFVLVWCVGFELHVGCFVLVVLFGFCCFVLYFFFVVDFFDSGVFVDFLFV